MGHVLNKPGGFTIVELLIVIVIIGILASLAFLGYNNIQAQAKNSLAVDAAKKAYDLIDLYHTRYSKFPTITNGRDAVCLGTHFKDYSGDGIGDCWDANGNGSDTPGNVTRQIDQAFLDDLAKAGTLNDNATYPVFYSDLGVYFVGPVFVLPTHESSNGYYGIRYWQQKTDTCPLGRRTYIFQGNIIECAIDIKY